jgi:hypothetical protein
MVKLEEPVGQGHRPSRFGEAQAWRCHSKGGGWKDGAPSHLEGTAALSLDLKLYKHMACARCKRRTNDVRPQHLDRRYRLKLTCRSCHYQDVA